ncbi:sensor histidine kinase [Epidermidibacterium keratini]|uniref:Oxygen sensor histidine kinase NreB n=1 Tax=Epidermidibacterium keratini TaxID=1891644 RepID=A0A7L4YN14_9ACTN|nr:sensor histidine kinase [Epidermidibacterium keratini]QHC00273.1 sensor histidine kinase [Epidermidibacterium keratini]
MTERHSSASVIRMVEIGQHVLFVALVVLSVLRSYDEVPARWQTVVLGGAILGWYLAGALRRTALSSARRRYLWLGVLVALWMIAMLVSTEYAWTGFALVFLVMHLLPVVPAVAVVVAITAVIVVVQVIDLGWKVATAGILGPIIGATVVVGLALAYRAIEVESAHRQRLVQELLRTQDDLVATSDALAAAQREAGTTAERERLAREIHDTLAQGFSSILLLSRSGLESGVDRAGVLAQIESTASDNLAEARRVVRALSPAELQSSSLADSLRRLGSRIAQQTGVAVDVRVEGTPTALDAPREVALLRIAQSALSNVRQHAQAQRAVVTLTYDERDVVLDVVDDGCGFTVTSVNTGAGGSFGLAAMRSRLRMVGGTLAVESAPGEGTALSARVPISVGSAL